jgi:hypothetical protein
MATQLQRRQRRGSAPALATKSGHPHARAFAHDPSRSSLVIFVDWDDTLFPTSELLAKAFLEDSTRPQTAELPPRVAKKLKTLEDSVLTFLEGAQRHGTIVLVTNAAVGWIDRLTAWAMPRVGLYIKRHHVPIRYARDDPATDPHDVLERPFHISPALPVVASYVDRAGLRCL